MIFKPLRKKTAAFLTKHMWVLFLLSNIKKLYCKNIFAIILFVISWNNIPAVFAGNSPKICIKNGSDRHITFRRQYDCLYSIYMPILIDKGEEQYVEVNDISEIYSMSALGYSKTCKVRFTRIIKEGECCIEVKISKWFADLGQKGYELLPGNSEPITIDENILSQFLSEENPTIYAKIPDARFDFFRTPISKEVIEEYIKE